MKQNDPLEKQLQSWIPRPPSPKIEARLFGRDRRKLAVPSHVWNWLTPAAACVLTFLVAASSSVHRSALGASSSAAAASATYDPQSPNTVTFASSGGAYHNLDANPWLQPWPAVNTNLLLPATNHSAPSAEL
jgi:hypothetical protein